jgi:hypothetical protein
MVVMVGIKGPVARRLTGRSDLKKYLKSVVPLPFHPDFKHKSTIEDFFRKADYRVINLSHNAVDEFLKSSRLKCL